MAGKILTNSKDVINNFSKYLGRKPTQKELDTYMYAAPTTLINDLTSASTKNKATTTTSATTRPVTGTTQAKTSPTQLNTTPLGASGVNSLFKQYYGRNATQDELNYWSKKSDADLRPKLIPNSATELAKSKVGGKEEIKKVTEQTEAEKKAAADAKKQAEIDAFISNSGLPPDQQEILRQMSAGTFKTDQKVFTEAELDTMMSDAVKNAETSLNPYYQKKTSQEIEDVKNKFADIRSQASMYAQQEGKTYKELLDKTKQSLRARGLTFSGEARKTLGAESGVGAQGVEGEVPKQRRFDYTSKQQEWNEKNRDLGIDTERSIGSMGMEKAGLSGLKIINPYGEGKEYQTGRLGEQYLVKQAPGGTPQEGYIRTGTQEQFAGTPNYRFLAETDLERQAAIKKRAEEDMAALTKKTT